MNVFPEPDSKSQQRKSRRATFGQKKRLRVGVSASTNHLGSPSSGRYIGSGDDGRAGHKSSAGWLTGERATTTIGKSKEGLVCFPVVPGESRVELPCGDGQPGMDARSSPTFEPDTARGATFPPREEIRFPFTLTLPFTLRPA